MNEKKLQSISSNTTKPDLANMKLVILQDIILAQKTS